MKIKPRIDLKLIFFCKKLNFIKKFSKKILIVQEIFEKSSIIKLKIFTDNKFEIDREEFIRFIKKGFSNPRKTLINSLYLSKFGSKKEIEDVIKSLKLDLNIRPGQINDSLWLKLYKIFEEKNED